jgi:hypothetical protein
MTNDRMQPIAQNAALADPGVKKLNGGVMKDLKSMEIAKEAYVLSEQLAALQEAMEKTGSSFCGYPAFARTYSTHLSRAKEILKNDLTILRTIEHLTPYNPGKKQRYGSDFLQIKADLPILRSALRSFFDFNFPPKEKQGLCFSS